MRLWGLYLTVWRALRTATLKQGCRRSGLLVLIPNRYLRVVVTWSWGIVLAKKTLSARPRHQSSLNPVWAPSLP